MYDDDPVVMIDGRTLHLRLALTPDGVPRNVALPRPTMAQYAKVYELASAADEMLPKPAPPPPGVNDDDTALLLYRVQVEQVLRDRKVAQFAPSSPHGTAVIEIVQLLTGTTYGPDDMDLAVMQPETLRAMLRHWEAPLGGQAADSASLPAQSAAEQPSPSVPSGPDSTEPTPGSLPGTDDSGQPSPPT